MGGDNVVNLADRRAGRDAVSIDLSAIPDFPSEMPAVVTVEPGQRLLLAFKCPLNMDQVHRLYDYLGERLPGLEFAAVGGVDSVVVLPAKREE